MASRFKIASLIDHDRRAAERHVIVLQLAILACGARRQLCLVLNLGRGGMKLRYFGHPPSRGPVAITMRGERVFHGKVAWRKDDLLGVNFNESLSREELALALSGNGARTRGPRLAVELKVSVRSGSTILPATMINISPSGAALDLGSESLPENAATLHIPGLHPVPAQVRWSETSRVGLSFNKPLLIRNLQAVLS